MNLKKLCAKKIVLPVTILVAAAIVFGFYWLHILKVAHSSFENYYNFRGCVQLIEKTDTYGTCKISSGKTIKIVKVQDRWYLDGDLPFGAVVPVPVACTIEAKICPDGTAVGRQGPSCEFAACPTPKSSAIVDGKVTLSPICPVERIPPDPQCAPKPYATNIQVFSAIENKLIKTLKSDTDGNFTTTLPFGDYKIQAGGGNPYPRCDEVAVSVKTSATISTNISCDTGIR